MLKNKRIFNNVVTRIAIKKNYKLSISLYTVFELMQTPSLYNSFAEIILCLPASIQKSHLLFLDDEMKHYPSINSESSIMFTPVGLKVKDKATGFKDIVKNPVIEQARRKWEAEKNEILVGMIGNVANFEPSSDGKYSIKRIEQFADLASYQYLENTNPEFIERCIAKEIHGSISRFKSVRMMMYVAFYKFYISKRKPRASDVPDVVMSAGFPYMNAVILEKDEAETLRQIKKRHGIIKDLEIYTLRDFR